MLLRLSSKTSLAAGIQLVTGLAVCVCMSLLCLQDMGFYDQEANVRALQATGGNVNAAVDRLLQGL
jgi:hypothetical protein